MDRLVCGDVGFGKTEVALRAAAVAALAGKQVAVLAPTTVLVRQHLETFRKRFAGFGLRIGSLSRLTPAAEAKETKRALAAGEIRIAVGTHALAAKGVRFRDLGLVVIDEEQRFGTRQKASLRKMGEGLPAHRGHRADAGTHRRPAAGPLAAGGAQRHAPRGGGRGAGALRVGRRRR